MESVDNGVAEKKNVFVQFFKYSLCGGAAFVVDMVTFFLVAWLLFPALTEGEYLVSLFDIEVQEIPENVRVLNFCLANIIAFVFSNLTAYVLNVLFVFEAGRHSRRKEVGLFYLVSGISIGIGVLVGALLIKAFGLSTTVSYISKAVAATLINFAGRKYIIFRG